MTLCFFVKRMTRLQCFLSLSWSIALMFCFLGTSVNAERDNLDDPRHETTKFTVQHIRAVSSLEVPVKPSSALSRSSAAALPHTSSPVVKASASGKANATHAVKSAKSTSSKADLNVAGPTNTTKSAVASKTTSNTSKPPATSTRKAASPGAGNGNGKKKKASSHVGAIVGGVIGGLAGLSAGAGGLVFWCRRRRRRRGRRNSQGEVIDTVSSVSGPRSTLLNNRGGEAAGVSLTSPNPETTNNLADIVHPFTSHGGADTRAQVFPRKGDPVSIAYYRGSEHREFTDADASTVSSPLTATQSQFTRTERESADTNLNTNFSIETQAPTLTATPSRNLRITNPENTQEVSAEIASLWNEINRLRQLVPGGTGTGGGGGSAIDEEPPPSYDSERLPQERDRLLTARDTLLRKASRS